MLDDVDVLSLDVDGLLEALAGHDDVEFRRRRGAQLFTTTSSALASSAALKVGEEPPPPPEPIDAVENHLAFVSLLADGTAPCSDEVREACRRLMGAPA